jgi:hypothetical protein
MDLPVFSHLWTHCPYVNRKMVVDGDFFLWQATCGTVFFTENEKVLHLAILYLIFPIENLKGNCFVHLSTLQILKDSSYLSSVWQKELKAHMFFETCFYSFLKNLFWSTFKFHFSYKKQPCRNCKGPPYGCQTAKRKVQISVHSHHFLSMFCTPLTLMLSSFYSSRKISHFFGLKNGDRKFGALFL